MMRQLLTAWVVGFIGLSAQAATSNGPDGFFISIDGINSEYVDILKANGDLTALAGLGWLSRNSVRSHQALPVEVTLTASSHVSTITCTPPSRHGIVANGFFVGDDAVSGFTHPFSTEPMWKAAARQGKTVLSLAYAGADGRTPERFADFGIAYPESSYVSRKQTIAVPYAELQAAQGWQASFSLRQALQHQVDLVLNPASGETQTLQILVLRRKQGDKVYIDSDKNLGNGYLTAIEGIDIGRMYFTETAETSPLRGFRRMAFASLLPSDGETFKMHLSGSSYNNAYPASFREMLDAADLVWPEYGISGDDLSIEQYIAGQSMIDTFLADVGRFAIPRLNPDIVLYYQPLVDSVGHKYEGILPQPFNPRATDAVTRTYVEAYKVIDRNLDRLYGAYKNSAVINLMGDHGMDPIKKIINLAALLPQNVRMGVKTESSGALVMLYDSQLIETFNAGEVIRDRLATLTYEGQPVGGDSRDRRDYVVGRAADYRDEWQHGEADWAFLAGTGFWFEYHPNDDAIFLEPPIYGMHGHAPDVATMATGYFFRAPGLRPKQLGEVNLIDAVPTFMARLGLEAPRDCLGTAIDLD